MSGTTPPGARDERQAAAYVRNMFADVAPRYDFLNHLLSFNIDRYWRSTTVSRVRHILQRPDARILDVCCGTGDLTSALRQAAQGIVFGADFCHPMLTAALRKPGSRGSLFEGDALCLPMGPASLDLITVAFGFRNLVNYEAALQEARRVLRPGGCLAILEFSRPPNALFNSLYNLYSKHVLPRVGWMLSGSAEAYTYLPESVRKFPGAPGLAQLLGNAGFRNVRFEYMTFGIVALHTAQV